MCNSILKQNIFPCFALEIHWVLGAGPEICRNWVSSMFEGLATKVENGQKSQVTIGEALRYLSLIAICQDTIFGS